MLAAAAAWHATSGRRSSACDRGDRGKGPNTAGRGHVDDVLSLKQIGLSTLAARAGRRCWTLGRCITPGAIFIYRVPTKMRCV